MKNVNIIKGSCNDYLFLQGFLKLRLNKSGMVYNDPDHATNTSIKWRQWCLKKSISLLDYCVLHGGFEPTETKLSIKLPKTYEETYKYFLSEYDKYPNMRYIVLAKLNPRNGGRQRVAIIFSCKKELFNKIELELKSLVDDSVNIPFQEKKILNQTIYKNREEELNRENCPICHHSKPRNRLTCGKNNDPAKYAWEVRRKREIERKHQKTLIDNYSRDIDENS